MLFNKAQRNHLENSASVHYSNINEHYHTAFERRREAAKSLIESETAISRASYFEANRQLQLARNQGVKLAATLADDKTYNDTNYIFLAFVMEYLPTGLIGLIMAAVFAAAMSSISSELNSLATVTVMDHYRRYLVRKASGSHYA